MLTKIISATLNGCDASVVDVEVSVQNGLPSTIIVGLADAAIKESKERVRACLRNSENYKFPLGRISVNLAPADIFKYGSHFDLAITLGILLASSQLAFKVQDKMFLGELSFNGVLRPVRGVLAMVIAAKERGIKEVYLPLENIQEARAIDGVELFGCGFLDNVVDFLVGKKNGQMIVCEFNAGTSLVADFPDFSEIKGQEFAKRGMEIAASGGHNLLLIGPPGCGKTMLAEAFQGILPKLDKGQNIETKKLYGVNGLSTNSWPPFRNPHHTISLQAFVGGGQIIKPGEISLAHNGVLFMDEFPEFPRHIIEALRQPLEKGLIRISRAQQHYTFPANFIFIAAQNPCPCGNYFDRESCVCSIGDILKYRKKISGPILDRIDLQIRVQKQNISNTSANIGTAEKSVEISKRVLLARQIQQKRNQGSKFNSRLSQKEIAEMLENCPEAKKLLDSAQDKFQLTLRTYFRIAKTARTIADLANSEMIMVEHLAEALRFRLQDKMV